MANFGSQARYEQPINFPNNDAPFFQLRGRRNFPKNDAPFFSDKMATDIWKIARRVPKLVPKLVSKLVPELAPEINPKINPKLIPKLAPKLIPKLAPKLVKGFQGALLIGRLSGAYRALIGRLSGAYRALIGRLPGAHRYLIGPFGFVFSGRLVLVPLCDTKRHPKVIQTTAPGR